MIALARLSLGEGGVLTRWGIYVVHPLIMLAIWPVMATIATPWRDIVNPLMVFSLALATTVLFSKYTPLRRFFA